MTPHKLAARTACQLQGKLKPLHASIVLPCIILCCVGLIGLSSCTDKISTIGAAYYPDSVEFRTSVRTDTSFMKFASIARPSVPASDTSYNLTYASPMMIIGRVATAAENLESWGVLQFMPLSSDTLSRVVGIRLLLKDIPYKFGDTSSNRVDFQVYESAGSGKLSYSTTQLQKSDLSNSPIGSIQKDGFIDSSDNLLAITIDTSIKKDLLATTFAFVVTPGTTMINARGFGTSENVLADANSVPQLEYTIKTDTGILVITRTPALDMHIIKDQSTTPPNEFTLRGGTGLRELLTFNLSRPSDTAELSAFSTINSAVLVLQMDPNNSSHSNLSLDTSGPSVVELSNSNDTGGTLWAVGYRDHPGDLTIRFQLRTLIEYWLRNPTLNLGLELRSGFVRRTFATSYVGVEDNTLNRWTFYGSDFSDPAKRPQLILSYSKLSK